jgi:tRNA nucleotidyltransferase/poly(A) polymerase
MPANQRKTAAASLRGLVRRAGPTAVARVARSRGIDVWIVGGAIRDRLLGRPAEEVDVAVSRGAEELAGDLEREGFGRSVFLSRGRPGPRVFRVASRPPLDVAEIEGGTIEADLGRRDFTVNALALAVPAGELLDPFGGVEDLRWRRLRETRPGNLAEDPLRILRAARLFATLGLEPEPALLAAARAVAPLFARVAPERVTVELSKLLSAPRASVALAWAARAGILGAALGPAWTDSSATRAARALAAFDDSATRRLQPPRRLLRRLAWLAATLPPSAARTWLAARRWTREEARQAAAVAGLATSATSARTRWSRWSWLVEAGVLANDALAVVERRGPAGRRSAARLRQLLRRPVRTVRVGGEDVAAWTGITPGPRLGELLREVRVAAAMGLVQNRREARNWLTGQVPEGL